MYLYDVRAGDSQFLGRDIFFSCTRDERGWSVSDRMSTSLYPEDVDCRDGIL
jgi:hypothetical protein